MQNTVHTYLPYKHLEMLFCHWKLEQGLHIPELWVFYIPLVRLNEVVSDPAELANLVIEPSGYRSRLWIIVSWFKIWSKARFFLRLSWRALHYHHYIVLIGLTYCWKRHNIFDVVSVKASKCPDPTTLTHLWLASHFWDLSKQCRPDQMPQNAASDLSLHCLLTGISVSNKMKMYTRHPWNWKWILPRVH